MTRVSPRKVIGPLASFLAIFGPSPLLHASPGEPTSWRVDRIPAVLTQELAFANGDVRLAGTLYLPANGNRLPGVVALHGASDATRGAALYQHLREGLPAMGFAVLIYDRRGSGASSGTLKESDYETLADDAIAAQRALAKVPRIDSQRIGFWGLSQGGWLAVLAAARSTGSAFAVSVSAPLVTPEEQMQFATRNLLAVRGYSQRAVRDMLETRKAWTGYLRGTHSRSAALDALRAAEKQPWFKLGFLPKASVLTSDPAHNSWRKEMDYDPIASVRSVNAPLLFIYGGLDPWVPVRESVERLRALVTERPNIAYAVIENASHEMMLRAHDSMEFDTQALNKEAPQAPAYFMLLASWLSRPRG